MSGGNKKKKKKSSAPPMPQVRFSQCMIVKNEEKNIEKALSWAKSIAFEQIVVDTGSTDRTVEIAKKMGAKIFHFEWINDFGAAKNYAIEQASGNWIAFLDADEYLSQTDTKKLSALLRRIMSDPKQKEDSLAVECPWVNIDDNGDPIGILSQIRVFRNIPSIRYIGKIHEYLSLVSNTVVRADDIAIMHTGYSETAFKETGKTNRNIELLRKATADNPGDYNLKAYLGEALLGMEDEHSPAEAEELFFEVISPSSNAGSEFRKKAYAHLLEARLERGDFLDSEELSRRALVDFPGDIDLGYYLGFALNKKKEYSEAYEVLQESEKRLLGSKALDESIRISANPSLLFTQLAAAAQGLGEVEGLVKYAAITLSVDKSQDGILAVYIATLLKHGVSEDEVVALLSAIYDMNSSQDLVLLANASAKYGASSLARRFADMVK